MSMMKAGLGSAVASGLRWLFVTKLLTQVVSWAATILIIRLLTPDAYGLMALATSFMVLLGVIGEVGLADALIQKEQLTDDDLRSAFTLGVTINAGIYLVLYAAAPAAASFFDSPDLAPVLRVLALQFVLGSFALVPKATLHRHLKFRFVMLATTASRLLSLLLTLALAWLDFGVWALVYGNLAHYAMLAVLLVVKAAPPPRPGLSLAAVPRLMSFGGLVTVERLLGAAYSSADSFIVGKFLGTTTLGIYNVALNVSYIPINKLFGDLNAISFPSFASIKQDRESVRHYYYKSTRLIAAVFVPMLWGISLVAEEIVLLFLGAHWSAGIVPLQVIALVLPLRQLTQMTYPMLLGLGLPYENVKHTGIALIVFPTGILIGIPWGLLGVSVAWLVSYTIIFALVQARVLRLIEASASDYLRNLSPTLLCSAIMYLVVLTEKEFVLQDTSLPLRLAAAIATGFITYTASTLILNRAAMRELMELVRR